MKIVYFGSSGPLSMVPLRHLLESGREVSAVAVLPDAVHAVTDACFPVVADHPDSIAGFALDNNIALVRLGHPLTDSAASLRDLAPDLVLVSCFAKRLPGELLSIPSRGCFNLHPSRLPAYRGPAPQFWQFRDGVGSFGVTWHRMSERLDAGNIVAQAPVQLPDGISAEEADALLAQAGAELLVELLDPVRTGSLAETPQDEGRASYRGFPVEADFRVSIAWPARRLFNFVRATANRGIAHVCEIDGVDYRLRSVDAFHPGADVPFAVAGDRITLPCQPGVVRARLLN